MSGLNIKQRIRLIDRGVAQLVEHRSPKPSAQGSSPCTPAINSLAEARLFFFIDAISLMVYYGINEHNWCGKYKVWCGNWCGCEKCRSLKAD